MAMEDSSAGRLVGVLVKPGDTFRSIGRQPTWVVPLVFLLLLAVASTFVQFQHIDRDAFRQQMQAQMVARGQQVSDEQLDRIEGITFKFGPYFGLVAILLFYFLGAAVMLAAMNAVGGEINYKTSLAVLLYASMPTALLALLAIPVALGRGTLTMDEVQGGRLVPSNLAVFAPEDAGRRLVALLASFDLFTFWMLFLLVLGYHLAGRVSKGAAAAVVIGLWLLLVAIKIGLAGLGGG
jgi:membrane protein, antimicrobial resistance system